MIGARSIGPRLEWMYCEVAGRMPTDPWGWLPGVMLVLGDYSLGRSAMMVNGHSRIYMMN